MTGWEKKLLSQEERSSTFDYNLSKYQSLLLKIEAGKKKFHFYTLKTTLNPIQSEK